MAKYLDSSGLEQVWGKINSKFVAKSQLASKSTDTVTGVATLDKNGYVPLNQLGNIDTTFVEVVKALPGSGETDAAAATTIGKHLYLLALTSDTNSEDVQNYKEYIYTGTFPVTTDNFDTNKWELVGSFEAKIDLADYAKKSEALGTTTVVQAQNTNGTEAYLTFKTVSGEDFKLTLTSAQTDRIGLMSKSDKVKLDKFVTTGASNKGIYLDSNGYPKAMSYALDKSVPATAIFTNMTGASSSAAGSAGYVPAPSKGSQSLFLKGDGTWATPTNTVHAYCTTVAETEAKVATHTGYTLKSGNYFILTLTATNTAQKALTLNVNNTGAKSIYLNGSATSASNYSISAGTYLVYYNGTNYYIRTDGKITGDITGNAATASQAVKLANSSGDYTTGTATNPVYFSSGIPKACTYSLNATVPSGAKFTDTTYTAGTGLSLSGTTFNHTNSITGATVGQKIDDTTVVINVPWITYDNQGHITETGTHTHTIPNVSDNVGGIMTSTMYANYKKAINGITISSETGGVKNTFSQIGGTNLYSYIKGNNIGVSLSGTATSATITLSIDSAKVISALGYTPTADEPISESDINTICT